MVRIFSNMVAPAGASTPPVMTSPTSPSAWQPTTEMERMDCIRKGSPELQPRDLAGGTLLKRRSASSELEDAVGRQAEGDAAGKGRLWARLQRVIACALDVAEPPFQPGRSIERRAARR